MKLISVIFTAALLSLAESGFSQSFVDLGFESPTFVSTNGLLSGSIGLPQAFPGWSATVGGLPLSYALSNTVYLDTAGMSIINSNYNTFGVIPGGVLQGRYTAILMSGTLTNTVTGVDASLSQTGLVPAGTRSLQFYALSAFDSFGTFTVTMDGQDLSLTAISNALNYTIYGTDISAWAGQTAQLSFNVLGHSPQGSSEYLYLDSIQFSIQPVPEPSTFALGALGALLLGLRRRQS